MTDVLFEVFSVKPGGRRMFRVDEQEKKVEKSAIIV